MIPRSEYIRAMLRRGLIHPPTPPLSVARWIDGRLIGRYHAFERDMVLAVAHEALFDRSVLKSEIGPLVFWG